MSDPAMWTEWHRSRDFDDREWKFSCGVDGVGRPLGFDQGSRLLARRVSACAGQFIRAIREIRGSNPAILSFPGSPATHTSVSATSAIPSCAAPAETLS
jgi:hypothetical protein